ncbi:ribonuclease-like 3 [Chanos chanos]|uniref:Ribonuclease-like 3 n=1 Tax=Chanos chanos TaxID=29144 RepID=A0A6J2UXD8_CHACN|nr:angiogenin [Chanos chanos]
MDIFRCALILTVILCAALPCDAQPANVQPRYRKFLSQHVNEHMNQHICTQVIHEREITETNSNRCKEVNSFIVADKKHIRDVCVRAGSPLGRDLYESTQPFQVVKCTLKSGVTRPHCQYKGSKQMRRITLGCDQGWPTHYDEDTVVITHG